MQSNLKLEMQNSAAARTSPLWNRLPNSYSYFLFLALVLLATPGPILAQVTVKTLGGGRTSPTGADAGFVDGNTLQTSQFNAPAGIAVDTSGNVYVADRKNGALRKLDVAGNRASTILSGLNQPVAVAVSGTNEIYVVTQGDGFIQKLDRFGNVSASKARLFSPTALAISSDGTLFATESGGTVVRVDAASDLRVVLKSGLNQPSGIAILDSGLIAVSDTGNHRILFLNPSNGSTALQVGQGVAGFRNGSLANSLFNQPHQLAKAPNGTLLVADRANHRVRAIGTDGSVTTLYGIAPSLWEGPECLTCTPIILPGWFDGSAEFAEAREPVGVAVSRDGKVYTTELFYHLVREVTGSNVMPGSSGGGSGSNNVVLSPRITPESGYFPLGQTISVFNPNTNAFFSSSIYYTVDGSEPTTNSLRLPLTDNRGTIVWRETTRDLTSLRLKAFVGASASETASGTTAATNQIGITRDIAAGIGSTIVVPVTVNLRPSDQLKSLQFLVEVAPAFPSALMIPDKYRALSVSTNDFIPVVTSSESSGPSSFSAVAYTNGLRRGLAITFIGTNANLSVKNFAVVAMVAVPIPPSAKPGDRFTIHVLNPSGTSDGAEAAVPLTAMVPRSIIASRVGYRVGDSSPATWYNAAELLGERIESASNASYGPLGFGDQRLDNSDVNNVFAAFLGLRVPYPFTDIFDAMDAYPEDTAASAGGDGLIRFLDWQVILRRSLGLDLARWEREWSDNGMRRAWHPTTATPNLPAELLAQNSVRPVWYRHASISAEPREKVSPGASVDVPVYIHISSGCRLAGLAFRASAQPEGGAPVLAESIAFVPAPGLKAPSFVTQATPDVVLCGWPIVPAPSFEPPLQNRNLVGHLRLKVPSTAKAGQSYTIQFSNADGSPDLQTQYDFETHRASVWIQTPALRKPDVISDEWKLHFFGSATADPAQENSDPDQDGASNAAEYQAGTHPLDKRSSLHLEGAEYSRSRHGLVLRWPSVPGRKYTLEVSSDLASPNWSVVANDLAGDGSTQEFVHDNIGSAPRFYRLRVQPLP